MHGVRAGFYPAAGGAGWAAALVGEGIVVARNDHAPIDALLVETADLAASLAVGDPVVPIVVVDGPSDPLLRARMIEAGATDVLAAPADPAELAARLRALARLRRGLRRHRSIDCADLRVDPLARLAERDGRPLPLHPREFALLAALAERRDRPVERMTLLGAVWRQRFDPGTNIVAVTVSRLRAKVDHGFARPLIHTVDGGYMLSDTAAVAARGS